jgi:hypothetical protein
VAAPTSTEFLAEYREFASLASDAPGLAMVAAAVAVAARRYSEEACAPFYADLVMRKAAQLLALSPFGQAARMVNKDGSTTYDAQIREWELSATFGNRVV